MSFYKIKLQKVKTLLEIILEILGNSSKLIAENIFVFLKNNEVEVNKNINKNQLVTSITNSKTLLMIKKLLLSIGLPEDFSFLEN